MYFLKALVIVITVAYLQKVPITHNKYGVTLSYLTLFRMGWGNFTPPAAFYIL